MKILHVTPTYFPATRYGGPIRSVHGLCRALAERGHEVHVVTTPVDGSLDSAVPLNCPVELDSVSVWYFRTGVGRRIYRSPDMAEWLTDHLRHFDVVHSHAVFLWPGWTAGRLATAGAVPLVVSPRGMLVKQLFRQRRWLLKSAVTQVLDRPVLESAQVVHVCSRVEEVELSRFDLALNCVSVIENGVGEEVFPVDQATTPRKGFAYLGRISWKKRIPELLEALKGVAEGDLFVAGNDEENLLPQLQSRTRELCIADRVTFLGEVHGSEKRSLLGSVQALIIPSLSENFANVALEALAAGTPVITTPGVGASEVLQQHSCGYVCDGSASSLAQVMQRVCSNPEEARAKGERGAHAVRTYFTWAAIAERFESLYSKILVTKPGESPCPVR